MSTDFCPDCFNLLYPKEDVEFKHLYYFCNSCNYTVVAEETNKEQNTVEFNTYNYRTKGDVHNYVTEGIVHDPTLPRDNTWVCQSCNNVGAVFIQIPDSVADEAMVLIYICTNCGQFVTKGSNLETADEVDVPADEPAQIKEQEENFDIDAEFYD